MAVYAAHLTRTLQGTPSIFQVTAQEALGATVKPALKKVVEYLAAVYPDKCGWCVSWYDELFLVFDCCLQYHYLKHYAASFSESFYGLLRVPVCFKSEFNSGPRLPRFLEHGSLILLVLVPYIREKVERIVERWREDEEDGRLGKSISDTTRWAAIRLYSLIHFISESAKLIHLALYLSGRAHTHSPILGILGLSLKDAPAKDDDDYTWTDFMKSIFTGPVGSATLTFPMFGRLLLRGVEYGAFVVQLLRWWEASRPAASPAPLPPPPPKEEVPAQCRNRCPVCLQPWRVPTVLPVSGLVFCYSCVSRRVRAHGACPRTRCPAREADLVRLYLD